MEHLDSRLKALQNEFNLSDELIRKIKLECCAHAINCSMEQVLLEHTSAFVVQQVFESLSPLLSAVEQ